MRPRHKIDRTIALGTHNDKHTHAVLMNLCQKEDGSYNGKLYYGKSASALHALHQTPRDWHQIAVNSLLLALLHKFPANAQFYMKNCSCFGILYDYDQMRADMAPMREELLRRCMHPQNVLKARDHWLLF